jgi:probable F420-dependent oxidoreductase
MRAFLDLARRAEGSGFDALYVSDHPGVSASPFTSLAAAAAVTTTLKLGTYVCNTGVREPVQLSSDAATLDLVSDGRCILGVGAGHTPAEWTMEGRDYPSAGARVERFGEFVEIMCRLLAGEVVNFHGEHVEAIDAFLLAPRPVQAHIPVLVGGNGLKLLRSTAGRADIISLTGLGRTLEDGHRHSADWSALAISERVNAIRQTSARDSGVVLDALVQIVEITNDTTTVAERVAQTAPGLTPDDVLDAPYALIGTTDEVADSVDQHNERWGFTSYVVREAAVEAIAPVIARFAR